MVLNIFLLFLIGWPTIPSVETEWQVHSHVETLQSEDCQIAPVWDDRNWSSSETSHGIHSACEGVQKRRGGNSCRQLLQVSYSNYIAMDEVSIREPPYLTSSDEGICWDFDSDAPVGTYINATCPKSCPFTASLSGENCFKACVPAGMCRRIHPKHVFANPVSMQCEPACGTDLKHMVSGCTECEALGRCKSCMPMHSPSADGTNCENDFQMMWILAYVLLGTPCFFACTYVVHLWREPIVNPSLAEEGLVHRKNCRPLLLRETSSGSTEREWQEFPLSFTRVFSEDVAGIGIVLYFRWLIFAACFGILILSGTYAAYKVSLVQMGLSTPTARNDTFNCPVMPSSSTLNSQLALAEFRPMVRVRNPFKWKPKGGRKANTKKNKNSAESDDFAPPAGDLNEFPLRMFIATCIIYVLVTCISLCFSVAQHRFGRQWREKQLMHNSYAVVATNLPVHVNSPEELKQFFQSELDKCDQEGTEKDYVIGVSIAFDDEHCRESIDICFDSVVDRLSTSKNYLQKFQAQEDEDGETDDSDYLDVSVDVKTMTVKIGNVGVYQYVDQQLLPPARQQPDFHELCSTLADIRSSGTAFVVLSSAQAARRLAALDQVRYSSGESISLAKASAEPPDVIWENFNKYASPMHYVKAAAIYPMAILGFAILYMPYAMHYVVVINNHSGPPGEGALHDFVLGLCIALGNNLLSLVTYNVAKRFALIEKGKENVVVLSLVFVGSLCNTICDVGTILILTNGVDMGSLVYGQRVHDGYDHEVASELIHLFVPGYLFLPYLIAPLAEHVVPYYLYRRLVQIRGNISLRGAEDALTPPEFDICWRYADILNICAMCLLLLLFTSPHVYMVFVYFLLFLALVAILDYVRLLRFTSQTFYTTEALSGAFSYWFALPTGILCGVVAWWAVQVGLIAFHPFACLLTALLVHAFVYCLILRACRSCVAKRYACEDMSYVEMCRKAWGKGHVYTYFNTNKVQVLRNRLLHKLPHNDSHENVLFGMGTCVPYVKGKVYLQPNMPKRLLITES